MFRKLIRSNVQRYQDTKDKQEKAAIVISIVDIVRRHGGRFLKQDDDEQWYDMGDNQARDKVGHSLRDQVNAQLKHHAVGEISPRKRTESPASAGEEFASSKRQRKSKPLKRSVSCPTKSPSPDTIQQQGSKLAKKPEITLSHLLEPRPLDGQIVPSFITFSNQEPVMGMFATDAVGGMHGGDTSNIPQAPVPQEALSFYQQQSLSTMNSGMRNLGLAPEQITPSQGRLPFNMPDFKLPLDDSMEPTPILEKKVHSQESKDQDQKLPPSFPPRPPLH